MDQCVGYLDKKEQINLFVMTVVKLSRQVTKNVNAMEKILYDLCNFFFM